MAKIKKIIAREILDSRGLPTIEGRLILDNDNQVVAAASSGESRGKYEKMELRDEEKRYQGFGVKKAVFYINELIGPKLVGVDCQRHIEIDRWLASIDKTEEKSQLGVNTLMTVSQLILKAAALDLNLPLYRYCNQIYFNLFQKKIILEKIPAPIFTLINGGKHGSKNLDFQEFQLIPATSLAFSQSLLQAVEIYQELGKVLEYRGSPTAVGQEGGFAPNLLTNIDGLEVIVETIHQKKLHPGVDVFLGLDLAASYYFHNGEYIIKDNPHPLKTKEYFDYLLKIKDEYNLLVLEDPFETEDFVSWKNLNFKLGETTYIVADDFVGGDKKRLVRAISEKTIAGVVIKFNQTATITEMLELINQAITGNLKIIFSHRLGETNDTIIADLAVGVQADFVKFGAPVRGERVAKYNRLLEIEKEIL